MIKPEIYFCLLAMGVFFMTALLCGVWKWRHMLSSPTHQAPVYVDIAHRASLLYSFAMLVLIKFLEYSPFGTALNLFAVGAPTLFFAVAIVNYIILGWQNTTDNEYMQRNFITTTGTGMLVVAEVGGFALLLGGFLWR